MVVGTVFFGSWRELPSPALLSAGAGASAPIYWQADRLPPNGAADAISMPASDAEHHMGDRGAAGPLSFRDRLTQAGGDAERLFMVSNGMEGQGMDVRVTGEIIRDAFPELLDALTRSEGGIVNDGVFQHVLTDFPSVRAGEATLTRLACSENLCAASLWSYDTDVLDAIKEELFQRARDPDLRHPAVHSAFFHDEHSVTGTERRIIFFTAPVVTGAVITGSIKIVAGPPIIGDASTSNPR